MCGLSTLWLVSAQKRRLDGFYCRCLRRILGIPSAYVCRISNKTVLQRACVIAFSEQLLHKQLILLGKVARATDADPIRQDVFVDSTLLPQEGRFIRRVGRPRQDWTTQVMRAGAEKFGSVARLEGLLRRNGEHAEQLWKKELRQMFCFSS